MSEKVGLTTSEGGDSMAGEDGQAQPRLSNWLSKVENALRVDQVELEDKLGFSIMKVPEYNRQPPEAYTPLGLRLGLHNRENLDTSGSEALKLCVAVALGLVGDEWADFYNFVVEDPKSMLICYGLHDEMSSWSEVEIKQVLGLDALFLTVWMDLQLPWNERQIWTSVVAESNPKRHTLDSSYQTWRYFASYDICKIENQIPLVLIKRAAEYIKTLANHRSEHELHMLSVQNDCQLRGVFMEKWLKEAVKQGSNEFMDISEGFYRNENSHRSFVKCNHILEAAYNAICGLEGLQREADNTFQMPYVHIPTVKKLRNSGIKVNGVVGPVCNMKYENKCLSLPKMMMFNTTGSFIRNMARYESYFTNQRCTFRDYIILMIDLIQDAEDLDILIKCGVIYNGNGSRALEKWNVLEEGLMTPASSKEHNDMKVAINRRCAFKRYKFWSEFRTIFCSRPWYVLSAVTIVVVTVATLLQTYAAIIGSNRMKPQFP